MLKIDLNNEPVVTRMLQIRLDVLAAARQLATAYLNVFKAEYSMIQNHRDNAIIVEISAKTDLETSPIVRIRYDDRGTTITVHVPPAYNAVIQLEADDYNFFSWWVNRIFTEDEFVRANKDFWLRRALLQS
ncbi:hypothetical protein [Acinetobacter baumannii]|uniref:hypothetical protein n=1 Tax=Acinetobacter baumannii TaxID=470 RepID=UPI0009942580|nr:hypothetical protein [Acinetobacter baumannii]OOS39914.1 hypothetical protein BTG59_05255 [Acinetobacter baumannii]OOS53902.1 hypothetical protein BMH56_01660 [Acinetobacter baumannii]OOS54983.1 hypothetical protein BTG64_11410 [Acinetobacter baumannii]OOU46852.1 hypothetical protein BTG71_09340 [Acinetobacter baumannii]OOU90778.1 hypothetical protein BTG77_07160 [Acinetobacter baumannii]